MRRLLPVVALLSAVGPLAAGGAGGKLNFVFVLVDDYGWADAGFNLRDDIGERRDLSAALPNKVQELREMLHSWQKSLNAKAMSPNPAFKGK